VGPLIEYSGEHLRSSGRNLVIHRAKRGWSDWFSVYILVRWAINRRCLVGFV
jgi:hypothetical protein